MKDRVRLMQNQIEKQIAQMDSEVARNKQAPVRQGLLAPRRKEQQQQQKAMPEQGSSAQKDTMKVLANYIAEIRRSKEEILNGRANKS